MSQRHRTSSELKTSDCKYLDIQIQQTNTQIPLLDTVAISTSGTPIYGPSEAQHNDPYGDPYINGILDFCHGHAGGQRDYNFHFAPTCMIKAPEGVENHYNVLDFALMDILL